MASTARIDELKKKFDENPRRYFAPLANEFRKSGDIEQAIIICEEFLPQQPGHMSGHIVYGQALYEAGRLPESRTVFETALGLDPENLIALRHLGDIAHGQGDLAAARTWYTRVLDADPRNEEIQALIASMPADTLAPADAVQIIAEEDFDLVAPLLTPMTEVAAVGVPMDIEKEEPSLEAAQTVHDTHPLGVVVVPSEPTPPPLPSTELIEGFSLHGFEASPERDTEVVAAYAPAEGLESTSFTPPEEPIPTVADLDDSLETGVPSFETPPEVIAAEAGLQDSGGASRTEYSEDVDTEKFAAAERPILDDDFVLPPAGDAVAEPAGVAAPTEDALASAEEELLDFDMDGPDAIVEPEPVQAVAEEAPSEDEEPLELSASVLAAESELIDAGETPEPEPAPDVEPEPAPDVQAEPEAAVTPSAPFDTETMAELYVAQGLTDKARGVYERLLAASPGDDRLEGLVASLTSATPATPERQAGPTMREFFARMAARRPGERSAAAAPPADDDFAELSSFSEPLAAPLEEEVAAAAPSDEPELIPFVEAAAPESEPEPVQEFEAEVEAEQEEFSVPARPTPSSSDVAPALERAAAMRTPTGSLDALFSNRNPGTSEDSAASALAQAFGATAEEEPLIVGRPARAASAELSLDSVFRDGPARPPRNSQSFSFDQFFTAGAVNAGTADRPASETPSSSSEATQGEPPAERSADDIQQFNSWLQGLKPR